MTKRGQRTDQKKERRIRIGLAKRILYLYEQSGYSEKLERFARKAYRLLKSAGCVPEVVSPFDVLRL